MSSNIHPPACPKPVDRPRSRPALARSDARPPTPREHGAWGILLVPFATAVGVAGKWNLPVALLLASVLCFYLARTALLKALASPGRAVVNWLVVLPALAMLFALPLVLVWKLWWLVAFAAAGAAVGCRKTSHRLPGQLVAVAALTLTAPAAWYAATGRLCTPALQLWLLNALYFAGGVFYVKMHVAAAVQHQPVPTVAAKLRLGRPVLAFHLLLLATLIGLAVGGWIPAVLLLAYVPILGRAVAGVARLSPVLRIKRLGWTEVAYSIGYAVSLVVLIRISEGL